jgi:hypothetical protein
MQDKMQVAQTILEQLGGGRFLAMTGARDLVAAGDGLRMRLPRGLAKDGISHVAINLEASDLYTVRFLKARNLKVETVAEEAGVYHDQLQMIFKLHTGLDTRL